MSSIQAEALVSIKQLRIVYVVRNLITKHIQSGAIDTIVANIIEYPSTSVLIKLEVITSTSLAFKLITIYMTI